MRKLIPVGMLLIAVGITLEHKKNGRPVEGEGWSEGAEEGCGRQPLQLCARPVEGAEHPEPRARGAHALQG